MSFSTNVRLELAHLQTAKECCQRAEIVGLTLTGGSLLLSGEGASVVLSTETAAVARRAYLAIRGAFGYRCEIAVARREYPRVRNVYKLTLRGEGAARLLRECGIVNGATALFPDEKLLRGVLRRDCCARAFVRGAYLGCGSVADPSHKYHLEFAITREEIAGLLTRFLQERFDLSARVVARRNSSVVYIKDAESIVTLLGVMGANEALLQMESRRVVKSMRNKVNRLTNCDNANIAKSVDAATRQAAAIQWLNDNVGLDVLSAALQQVARARLEYRNMSLEELGRMVEPPLAKSAVNHRLRRIEELVAKYRHTEIT